MQGQADKARDGAPEGGNSQVNSGVWPPAVPGAAAPQGKCEQQVTDKETEPKVTKLLGNEGVDAKA